MDQETTDAAVTSNWTTTPSSMPQQLQLQEARSLDKYLDDAYEKESKRGGCAMTVMKQWKYWAMMLSLGMANCSDAAEILCLSYILADESFRHTILLTSQHDDHNSLWKSGMLAAAVFYGMLLGGLFIGTLADFFGRRPTLLMGLIMNSLAGLLSAASPNVYFLTFFRFIAGLGIGAMVPPLFTLVSELAPTSQRGFCVTLCASFWMVGSIYVALTAMWLLPTKMSQNDHDDDTAASSGVNHHNNHWRIFSTACALPSALAATCIALIVPESPRFLALKGQWEHALESLHRLTTAMHCIPEQPLLRWELQQIYAPRYTATTTTIPTLDAQDQDSDNSPTSLSSIESTTLEDEESNGHFVLANPPTTLSFAGMLSFLSITWNDFLLSASKLFQPSLRQTTWPLCMVWFTISFGTYGLYTWINTIFYVVHLRDIYFNALLFALSNLPGNLLSALCMDSGRGRTNMLVTSIVGSSLSLFFFAYFAQQATLQDATNSNNNDDLQLQTMRNMEEQAQFSKLISNGIVLSACCFQCFAIMAWNSIDVMTGEQFPTTVRSSGMGICAASGRIGAMMAQFINGALIKHPVALLGVASITMLFGGLTPFLLPSQDMTGQGLADNIEEGVDVDFVAPSPLHSHSPTNAYIQCENNNTQERQGLVHRKVVA